MNDEDFNRGYRGNLLRPLAADYAVERPSFDETWLNVARTVAKRGTCPRLQVGAVIVDRDNIIIATGYNGAPSGLPHCTDVGCLTEETECPRCNGRGCVHRYQAMAPDVVPVNCDDVCGECQGSGKIGSPRCLRTAHAEANALLQADPIRRYGGSIYTTHSPCIACAMLIIQSGIADVHFSGEYKSQPVIQDELWTLLERGGIKVTWHQEK